MTIGKALELVDTPVFLQNVEKYLNKWLYLAKLPNGPLGRWLCEYQQMEDKGLFKPAIFKAFYKLELQSKLNIGFIKSCPVHYVGVYAMDDTYKYYSLREHNYKICVITGEIACDDDGDDLIGLSYDEAKEICDSMNTEAEEKLFKVMIYD